MDKLNTINGVYLVDWKHIRDKVHLEDGIQLVSLQKPYHKGTDYRWGFFILYILI